jgi:steroid delta-isomerase-like uncharacterized protein
MLTQLVVAISVVSPSQPGSAAMNEEIVRSIFEVGVNAAKPELIERAIAPDFVGARGERGPAGFAAPLNELRAAFPDIRYNLEDVVAAGDRVALRWTWTGTHRGAFRGSAATEKRFSSTGMAFFQLRDGRIVRAWLETDRLGFLHQIGLLPPELAARVQPPAPK